MAAMHPICGAYFMSVTAEDYSYSKNKTQFQSVYRHTKSNTHSTHVHIYFESFLIIVNNWIVQSAWSDDGLLPIVQSL